MIRFSFLLSCLVLAACQSPTKSTPQAANTLPGPEESPNLFEFYSPDEDARLAEGWAATFDLSGVSFDSRETATLVTRRHVVMAAHFKRKTGARVVFHNRRGQRLERQLLVVRKVMGDVAVGLLDREVPAGYRVYPLPAPGTDPEKLVGQLAAVTDQHRRLFFHRIQRITGASLAFRFERPTRVGWSKNLVAGDSGNPSFLPVGPELVLLETHTSGGPGSGPYYGDANLQQKLQEVIDDLAPGYRLRFRSL